MNPRRLGWVLRREMAHNFRRPLLWFWLALLAFGHWQMSTGNMQIMVSGDGSIGGKEQWLTSEFAFAQVLTAFLMMIYTFFVAIAAGMTIIKDDEWKVGELLHGTRLTSHEYIWGKFGGAMATFLVVLAAHALIAVFCYHVLPDTSDKNLRGPFEIMNYVRPVLIFGVPFVLFLAGASFAVGEYTRRPILVFLLPVIIMIACTLLLWNWSPNWLDPRVNRLLMLIDPTGYRWLQETYLKVDRGVDFYNTRSIEFDGMYLFSRLIMLLIGVAPVALCSRHFARRLRGAKHGAPQAARRPASGVEHAPAADVFADRPLAALAMSSRPPGLLRGVLTVTRFELKELRTHPGLYLFAPFILTQALAQALIQVGPFGTPLLLTSGTIAAAAANTLTLLVCALLLFYTVESQQRERNTNLAPIFNSTAAPSAAIIFGKTLANAFVAIAVLFSALIGGIIALWVQGRVGFESRPFVLIWGLMLIPTFMVWTAFITAVVAVTRNRYTTYAVGIAVFVYTFYRQFSGRMNWVGNWNIWDIAQWSDIAVFELNRWSIALNRIMVLGLTLFFTAIAVRFSGRRELDAVRIIHRLRPVPIALFALRMLPLLIVPTVCGGVLWYQARSGFQGKAFDKARKDYWGDNIATWLDAPVAAITGVDIDARFDPARRWFAVKGTYDLTNPHAAPMPRIPITAGVHFEDLEWTMNGQEYEPDNKSRLYVFTPESPLATGDSVRIGFEHHGFYPKGATENGGGSDQFILPSGVVLHSFTPSFVPVVGYDPDIGVDEDNKYEQRDYPDQFYEGITRSAFRGQAKYKTRIRISGPADMTYNSVGVCLSDEVDGDMRTVVWESDHPVNFFNIVAGRWEVRQGEGTKVFYDARHAYNIDEISAALDAARKYYSEWFAPYPWKELKLSEFPMLANYAQGFSTNITFSEGIGFLTKNDPRINTPFLVTAHEAAHQWWGNILVPGRGPGGNILSEGLSHFSTILLFEQVRGPRERIEFCKRIESTYADNRRVDAERPLVKTDGSKSGDTTVTYDKGGWVFWMLLNHMGRDRMLAGLQAFIAKYDTNPDHPVLQDFIASMRPFATDPQSYQEFVDQWFFDIVVSEYRLIDPTLSENGDGGWTVALQLKNTGSGRMPVEVAASTGQRFDDDGNANPEYRESRTTVTLGAGEIAELRIPCDFKPDRITVDPDALVFQLRRETAVHEF